MSSKMGRAIVANSSMSILLKQSPSAVDVMSNVFKLTEEEKKRLANFPIGQGLFFAGQSHVHIQIDASEAEKQLANTNPQIADKPLGDLQTQSDNGPGAGSYINPGSSV
jgi:deferrochelatase/peroxidase EfeB